MMAKGIKKEPISDLTKHNLKREEEVRAATKRLDEYLVTKFDLNKPKSGSGVSEEKTQEEKPKTSEAKESKQTAKSTEGKNDKKAEEKESEIKVNSFHIVKKGDTLYSIARKYKLTVAQLKSMNGLKNNIISIDQKLKIN